MNLVDLNPGPVSTRVGEMVFKLRLFDLHAVVWAESFFSKTDKGGFNTLDYIINDEEFRSKKENWPAFANTIIDTAFYLSVDLEISRNDLLEKVNEKTEDSNPSKAIAVLSESIKKVFKKSFPQGKKDVISGGDIFNKSVQDKEQKPTDWSKVYSDFYRFGGMTIDQFYALTMTQIDAIYGKIDESRKREEVEKRQFQCAIHGVKKQNWPKMPTKTEPGKEVDEDEIKRRQEEHEKLFKGDKWPKV